MRKFRLKWFAMGYRAALKDVRYQADRIGTVAHANFLLTGSRGMSEARYYQGQADTCSEIIEMIENLWKVEEAYEWEGRWKKAKDGSRA